MVLNPEDYAERKWEEEDLEEDSLVAQEMPPCPWKERSPGKDVFPLLSVSGI